MKYLAVAWFLVCGIAAGLLLVVIAHFVIKYW